MASIEEKRLLRIPIITPLIIAVLTTAFIFPISIFNDDALRQEPRHKVASDIIPFEKYLAVLESAKLILLPLVEADDVVDAAKNITTSSTDTTSTYTSSYVNFGSQPTTCSGSTGSSACIPQFDSSQQSSYSSYYSNNAGLGAAGGGVDTDWTTIAGQCNYINATSKACTEQDANNFSFINSTAQDIIENAYYNCTKVQNTGGSNTTTYQTCSGTQTYTDVPCTFYSSITTSQEVVYTRCGGNIPYQTNQIYAVCQDNYTWYKVPLNNGELSGPYTDDCECIKGHPDGYCYTDVNYLTIPDTSSLPAGAVYLGVFYDPDSSTRDRQDGWDR